VKNDGIEPLAATPLNNGHRVTAGDGEHPPKHTLAVYLSASLYYVLGTNVCIKTN